MTGPVDEPGAGRGRPGRFLLPPLLIAALAGCVPTLEMPAGAERERLGALVEQLCEAMRSPDPADDRALFADPVRSKLRALARSSDEFHLTSVDPRFSCAPGRIWYRGGSRMFAEVRMEGGSDRIDVWRGEAPLIRNLLYGRPRRVGEAQAGDLEAALDLLPGARSTR